MNFNYSLMEKFKIAKAANYIYASQVVLCQRNNLELTKNLKETTQ